MSFGSKAEQRGEDENPQEGNESGDDQQNRPEPEEEKGNAEGDGDEGANAETGDEGANAETGDEGTDAETGDEGTDAETGDEGTDAETDDEGTDAEADDGANDEEEADAETDSEDEEEVGETGTAKKLSELVAELEDLLKSSKGDSEGGREAARCLIREAALVLGKSDGHQWKGPLPKGWTAESRKKFWQSLTGRAPKHKVTQCIKKMKGKVGDPGAFCAALADREIPGWRTEAAKERKKKAALGLVRGAASLIGQPLRTRRDYGEQPPLSTEEKPHSEIPTEDEPKYR